MRPVTVLALLASLTAFATTPTLAGESDAGTDMAAIKEIITRAYLDGIHRNRDRAAIESGFHPGFVMHVSRNGDLIQVPLANWLERMPLGTPNDKKVEADFVSIDVVGDTATAKLEVSADGEHIYTDFMGLYRFEDGWKIVNKIFESHR